MLWPSARRLGGGHLHGNAAVRRRRLRAPREVIFAENKGKQMKAAGQAARLKMSLEQISTRRRLWNRYSSRDKCSSLGWSALGGITEIRPRHGFKRGPRDTHHHVHDSPQWYLLLSLPMRLLFFSVYLQSAIHFYSPKTEKDGVAANRLMTYGLHPAVNISTRLCFRDLIIVTFF